MSDFTPFKLSKTLSGHEQDVRAVLAVDDETIVSCSRDGTVRTWNLTNGNGNSVIHHSAEGQFVNCLSHLEKDGIEYIVSGGKDTLVNLTKIDEHEPSYVLVGHIQNVCCLDTRDELIMSGSWDCTAKVWENFKLKYDLVGHEGPVWDCKILSEDVFLTCGGDRGIKLWQGEKCIKEYLGHQDVIRGLLILPDGENFASCSNDGTIKFWNIASGQCLRTLEGHESFVYSLAMFANGDIVSCAEDRTVRIWREDRCLQAITLPCISVWDVAVQPNNGDLIVATSDSQIRIFTQSEERVGSAEVLSDFQRQVEESAISENSVDTLNKEKIPGPEVLETNGREGQTVMVKLSSGIIEAHQWSNDKWVKIGEVVGSAGGSDKKKEYDGKFFDYVFDVDVKDGAPPLKLAFNVTDNPYEIAQNFLQRHELPASYVEEIVRFILDNTKGVQLGGPGPTTKVENPYADTQPAVTTTTTTTTNMMTVLPQTVRLKFAKAIDFQIIEKINNAESSTVKLSHEDLQKLKTNINDKKKNGDELYQTWCYCNEHFNNKIFVYDFLRSIVKFLTKEKLESSELIHDTILKGLTNPDQNINIVNLCIKILCNISYETIKPIEKLMPQLKQIVAQYKDSSGKINPKLNLGLSTLLLNISTYRLSNDKIQMIAKILKQVIDSELKVPDSESEYRALIAMGNLAILDKNSQCADYLKNFKSGWDTSRFLNLEADSKKL